MCTIDEAGKPYILSGLLLDYLGRPRSVDLEFFRHGMHKNFLNTFCASNTTVSSSNVLFGMIVFNILDASSVVFKEGPPKQDINYSLEGERNDIYVDHKIGFICFG